MWLDVAKDYQQQAILAAPEELIRQDDIALILPRTVIDEFARNKARVIEDSSRSLSSTLKRAKEAVEKFGDPRKKSTVLSQLNDVDYRVPTLGSAAVDTVGRIEKLFVNTALVEISDSVKLRAAQRAIDKRAPLHRQRNGIDDAVLIEVYADAATLSRNRIQGDKLFLYTAKTGTPVYCPLPPFVMEALNAIPESTYFFWTGLSTPKTAAGIWQAEAALCLGRSS